MRTPRVVILVFFFTAAIFLFARFVTTSRRSSSVVVPLTTQKSSFRNFFSFSAPFSIFPPSAAISLTGDNSTFFPARPAAFGPLLPSDGLSGRLWIGSGFSDAGIQEGEGEGELGCSDITGWEVGRSELAMKAVEQISKDDKSTSSTVDGKYARRGGLGRGRAMDRKVPSKRHPAAGARSVDDGTDDYLHQGLQPTKNPLGETGSNPGSSHADIQSIQETAEITGKIALLSRGGCGFLEKVKWAQRRGAIALIVGDNQIGGPLIQMFARGNVDNVTIPSVFTSRVTARVLSSLMQPGSFIEDILDENGNPVLKVQQSGKGRKNKKVKDAAPVPPSATKAASRPKSAKIPTTLEDVPSAADRPGPTKRSWISRLLWWWGSEDGASSNRSRPPSSGRLDWVIVDEWSDEKDKLIKSSLDKASKSGGDDASAPSPGGPQGDGFQIGVQDWRDPDLVGASPGDEDASSSKNRGKSDGRAQTGSTSPSAKQASKHGSNVAPVDANGPKGGSITPGSGEYAPDAGGDARTPGSGKPDGSEFASSEPPASTNAPSPTRAPGESDGSGDGEGLWVTITPTSGAAPFFDTLVVLVISPLITLTVVYALLMLRAKIRRRRWRAPKSVVEQLPVRTYHTITSPNQSPRLPSTSNASPTTPLLQGRPRSRTTTGVPDASDHLRADNAVQTPTPGSHESKPKPSEWAKYMGRQVECVVCLEEYVDGVSRVMSLPCGHEFHAECM